MHSKWKRLIYMIGITLLCGYLSSKWTYHREVHHPQIERVAHGKTEEPRTSEKTRPQNNFISAQIFNKETLEKNCDKMNDTSEEGGQGVFSLEYKHRILFCQIRKGGSQYWESLISVLDGTKRAPATYSFRDKPDYIKHVRETWRKVMFIREPWGRLWSAYNDKFANLHPVFWARYDDHLRGVLKAQGRDISMTCLDDITFSEFIDLILLQYARHEKFDAHWMPFYHTCRPCENDFDYVGKMEELSQTFDDMVHSLNIGDPTVLQDKMRSANYSSEWLPAMFRFSKRDPRRGHYDNYPTECRTLKRMVQCKWNSLINQGYFDSSILTPSWFESVTGQFKHGNPKTRQVVRDLKREAAVASEKFTSKQKSLMKRQNLQNAMNALNNEQICSIEKVYMKDFLIFDYPRFCPN